MIRISHDTKEALDSAIRIAFRKYGIMISAESHYGKPDIPEMYKVNWAAWGSQYPTVARDYAYALIKATDVAEMLNGMNLIDDRKMHDDRMDAEDGYEKLRDRMVELIENYSFGILELEIKGRD